MTDLTRRARWPVAGALAVALAAAAASSVLLAPPSPAVALDGASASVVGAGKTTLTYCHNGGVTETLDVYEPAPLPSTPVPAVVYVHGGGWVQGDAALTPGSLVGQVAAAISARGWIVVSINYRLAPRFPWPAQIDDATCAIRFLRAQAASLHIDPRHIGAIGDSAGGQIVSLLGLGAAPAGPSSALQAVADLYGPADLVATDWGHDPFIQVYARQAFGTEFGPGSAGAPTTTSLRAASPVTYVGRHAPPFLIIQGAEDTVVPRHQSEELAYKLRAAGNTMTLVEVRHAGHGLVPAAGGTVTPPVTGLAAQTTAFLVRHLQAAPARLTGSHRTPRP